MQIIQDRIMQLKLRKAACHGGILNEYIVYAGPQLAVHLSVLFTAMLRNPYVRSGFLSGVVKPILKISKEIREAL